jgi:SAM-dependent methyltransferase
VAFTAWLDRVLYRHPFEGASARRYATSERPAFGDFDDRLLDALAPRLDDAATRPTSAPLSDVTLLDVGAGPGTFAMRAAARFPQLRVIAVEPSRELACSRAGVEVARARGEALPLADASVDVAICLSSIRHVRDRPATLRELRRVVRRGGRLVIAELDPHASSRRIAAHADRLGSALLRHAFGPLVVRTAPTVTVIEALAHDAGWATAACRDDAVQPVYILELE